MTLKISAFIKSSDLQQEAFTHKSVSQDRNFERLEFLGDSLLGSKITELLYQAYPYESEGSLSRWRSALVSQETLEELCDDLSLTNHLICVESEREHLSTNSRIKASLFESFLGAYFLSSGHEELMNFIKELYVKRIKNAQAIFEKKDPKTLFQERAQEVFKLTPVYRLVSQKGPSHSPIFKAEVLLGDEAYEIGEGKSLKLAQVCCAQKALEKLENR